MFDVDAFIADCRRLAVEDRPTPAVKELLERALADSAAVVAALGEPDRGGLAVLHTSPELTVLNAVWAPQMTLYPHNHNMWAAIGIYGGREDNLFFRRDRDALLGVGGRELEEGEVAILGPHVIHSVRNPRRAFTGAIHVYGGDFFQPGRSEWDPQTLQERPYDSDRVRAVFDDANATWEREQRP
jgi:predicted metal-dependent enzyme (double-stranded beta helix superfamily)